MDYLCKKDGTRLATPAMEVASSIANWTRAFIANEDPSIDRSVSYETKVDFLL